MQKFNCSQKAIVAINKPLMIAIDQSMYLGLLTDKKDKNDV